MSLANLREYLSMAKATNWPGEVKESAGLRLTPTAKSLLLEAAKRCNTSQSEIVEALIRRYTNIMQPGK